MWLLTGRAGSNDMQMKMRWKAFVSRPQANVAPGKQGWLLMDWGKAFVSQAVTMFDKLSMECQALWHTASPWL
jgi:hypothetical protein